MSPASLRTTRAPRVGMASTGPMSIQVASLMIGSVGCEVRTTQPLTTESLRGHGLRSKALSSQGLSSKPLSGQGLGGQVTSLMGM